MEQTKQLVDSSVEENKRTKPPKLKVGKNENELSIDNAEDGRKFLKALGTADSKLASMMLDQVAMTFAYRKMPIDDKCNIALALLHGVKPRDELEAMLAAQMLGAHNLSMTFMKRAMLEEQTVEGVETNTNGAVKCMRTFAAQIEALTRYRGKGQQKVVVKHVHVNEGGQAIVGNVEGGGGSVTKRQ